MREITAGFGIFQLILSLTEQDDWPITAGTINSLLGQCHICTP